MDLLKKKLGENSKESNYYQRGIEDYNINDYNSSVLNFLRFISISIDNNDIALAFLNCGFIYFRLGKYNSSISYFSKAIRLEEKIGILINRSKSISYRGRCEAKYKSGDFKGAVNDMFKSIELKESEKLYNNYTEKTSCYSRDLDRKDKSDIAFGQKYDFLLEISNLSQTKYDLIKDYKKVLNEVKKVDVICRLKKRVEQKYALGDYKGTIRAMRRLEKYL